MRFLDFIPSACSYSFFSCISSPLTTDLGGHKCVQWEEHSTSPLRNALVEVAGMCAREDMTWLLWECGEPTLPAYEEKNLKAETYFPLFTNEPMNLHPPPSAV